MNTKKPSKKQMETKMQKALVFIPKGKDYLCASLNSRGIVIESNDEFAVVSRAYARTIFSKPSVAYVYLRLLCQWINKVETAYDNETQAYVSDNIYKWLYLLADQDAKLENPYILRLCFDFFVSRNDTLLSRNEEEKGELKLTDLYLDTCRKLKMHSFIFKKEMEKAEVSELALAIEDIDKKATEQILELVAGKEMQNPSVFPKSKDDIVEPISASNEQE